MIISKSNKKMTYTELLTQRKWFEKCNHILQRDKYTCQDCGNIGYHNSTIYITESLDEIDCIINEKILIGDKFSSLIEQTFNGNIECDKVDLTDCNVDVNGEKCPANENERGMSQRGDVRWEPYHDVKIQKQDSYDGIFLYKIWLYDPTGKGYFKSILEKVYATIITNKQMKTFDYELYRYRKYVTNSDGSHSTYPMAILKFDAELTDKYHLSIEDEEISVTYKNYVFFVRLNPNLFTYKGLNVHHKYYITGLKPWEYDDDALITLCQECHQKRHEIAIPKYRSLSKNIIDAYCHKCKRCGGSGYLPQYNHVQNGICFNCGGEGTIVS
jgi:5-methylcytosine-specific restriction endonuclease McrA